MPGQEPHDRDDVLPWFPEKPRWIQIAAGTLRFNTSTCLQWRRQVTHFKTYHHSFKSKMLQRFVKYQLEEHGIKKVVETFSSDLCQTQHTNRSMVNQ